MGWEERPVKQPAGLAGHHTATSRTNRRLRNPWVTAGGNFCRTPTPAPARGHLARSGDISSCHTGGMLNGTY
jgi:hypothetical protein